MKKDELLNRYIMYIDKDGKWRQGKVTKINGNTLTIKDAYKERHRIHPKKNKILGALKGRKIKNKNYKDYLEEIEWI